MMMTSGLTCVGDNIRGPRQESRDVSGTSNTRDYVQVEYFAIMFLHFFVIACIWSLDDSFFKH